MINSMIQAAHSEIIIKHPPTSVTLNNILLCVHFTVIFSNSSQFSVILQQTHHKCNIKSVSQPAIQVKDL